MAFFTRTTSQTAASCVSGTVKWTFFNRVSGVPPVPCGQLALVIVQTAPCAFSLQSESTVAPPLDPVKTGPLAEVVPSSAVARRSSTESKVLRATFACAAV